MDKKNINNQLSDLEENSKAVTEVEDKRFKLERYMLYIVLGISALGIAYAFTNTSILQTVISWFSPSGGNIPDIVLSAAYNGNNLSQISNHTYPTFNNTFVRFIVSFNDSDYNDWHSLVICNNTVGNYTLSVSGVSFNFTCGSSSILCMESNTFITDNPVKCDMNVYGYGNQTQNYTAYVIDSGKKVNSTIGTFVVDRAPRILSIDVVKIN